ncbi:MAG: DUF5688 family protein [Butyrivibrio sp.]|nr:DUF5688 family protein [Butyrivibrio sp.]
MNIKEFGIEMEKSVKQALGNRFEVNYTEVQKNNGVMYHALGIRKCGQNIAPTIYIDSLFDSYNNGSLFNNLVKEVVRIYNIHAPKGSEGAEFYQDFSQVADRLFFKAVNFEKNRDKLKDVPYKRALDLALVPLCKYKSSELGDGVITVQNSHLNLWEITSDELWENVNENSNRNAPVRITGLFEIMEKITGQQLSIDEIGQMSDACGMYVITNEQGMYGAAAAFYPDVLKSLADDMETDLFIIPSSVHEVIILPDPNFGMDVEQIRSMIGEVNETAVREEDILSDNLYVYDREADRIFIAGANEERSYA